MTNISDLSWELVEGVLSRVPITCIGVVRSTCKRWNGLSKDGILCKAEARRHQFLRFMLKEYRLCSIRFDLHGILEEEESVDPSPSIKEIGDSLVNHQVEVTKFFHCDGLLLCVTKDKDKENEEDITSLVVWNPYLGQTRCIKPTNNYHRKDSYALGYDNNRKHKILRLSDDHLGFEIYDFSSDSWRVLDITPDWEIMFYELGVSLKGNTYFFAKEKMIGDGEHEEPPDFLLCFDFTRERFGPPLPLPFHKYAFGTGALSSLRDEKLAALYHGDEVTEVEIWVTTKIEPNAVSWNPFLKVDMEPLTGFDFQFAKDGASFLIDEEKKVAVVFHLDESGYDTAYVIGENGYLKKVSFGEAVNHQEYVNPGEYYGPLVCSCSYVPSLVHINQFAGGPKIIKEREEEEANQQAKERRIDHH